MSQVDYDVGRCTRRCASSGRVLQPGEWFFSLLVEEDGELCRRDFASECWEGPPEEGAVGWWRAQIPTQDMKRARMAPGEVLLDLFEQTTQQPEQQDLRFVLSLLLQRRRILRHEESEADEDGVEVLVLYCPRNETTYRVRVVPPQGDRIETLQNDLARVLFPEESS